MVHAYTIFCETESLEKKSLYSQIARLLDFYDTFKLHT